MPKINKTEKNVKIDINEYLEETTPLDYYITENITNLVKDKNFMKMLEKNIILLGKTNKLGNNSINILLDNGKYELIKEMCADIYLMSVGKYKVADQTSYNYLIQTKYKEKTKFTNLSA